MKTVLITGASGGIGSATAACFAQNGWNVALHYHQNYAAAIALKNQLSNSTHVQIFPGELSSSSSVNELLKQVTLSFGKIDALVNNVGIAQQKLFTELTDEDWRTMFAVNTDSTFYTCREVLHQMIARHSGAIVNLSSVWGITGASCEVHYSASKAAVIGLTKALAKEVGPSGIRINCVTPGVIDTKMNHAVGEDALRILEEETPLGRMGTPAEVAELIFFLCSDKSSFLTGQVISPDGGFAV